MADIIIENIVASTHIKTKLDLQLLANKIQDSKYDPDTLPGLVFNFSNPKIDGFLFSNGRIFCTGAKKIEDAENVINKIIHIISNSENFNKDDIKIEIQNIVASLDLGASLNLTSIANNLQLENIQYDPNHFPGMILKIDDKSTTLILFESGKIICTGINKFEDLTISIKIIKDKLSLIGIL